ncbi:MAG: hypothetical protein ACKO9H_13240 [Planctomycetota bacterium]
MSKWAMAKLFHRYPSEERGFSQRKTLRMKKGSHPILGSDPSLVSGLSAVDWI